MQFLVLATLLLLFSGTPAAAQVRAVMPPSSKPSQFFSPAVDAGDYVFISGQGPRRPDGSMPTTFAEQCRQAFGNVKAIVESDGLTTENLVYTQVYLQDVTNYGEMDRIFGEFFPKTPPARAVLGVARVPDPPIQISAVAVRDLADRKAVVPPNLKFEGSAPAGVLTRDLLFISSMPGSDPLSGSVPEDSSRQVDMALDGLEAVVKAAGLELSNMVFVNPYLTAEIPMRVMNDRYAHRFEFGNTPARATIEVSSLPRGVHIEYTGVAVRHLQERRSVRPKNMPPSPTASPCVFAGNLLFCSAKSGFIPGPHGGVYAETTPLQLRQTMRNQLDNLEEADMGLADIVSTNVYLDNIDDLKAFDGVYGEYIGPVLPARTVVEQIAPADRKPDKDGHYTDLEQVSLIAVRKASGK